MPVVDETVVPYVLPLSASDVATHLNLTNSLDGGLIRSKLVAAADWVAAYTGLEIELADPDDDAEPDTRPVVPPRVQEAILKLAAELYQNRETSLVGVTAQELPFGLLDMLSDYRAWCA